VRVTISPVADALSFTDSRRWDDPDEQARFTRVTADRERSRSALLLDGIDCAACTFDVERALAALDGVASVAVDAVTGRAQVEWYPARVRLSSIARSIHDAGYRAYPALDPDAERLRGQRRRAALWRLFVAGFCMMQLMMYAAPGYLAGGTLGDDVDRLLKWASWVLCMPVVVFAAAPFLLGAARDLGRGRLGMDVPVALGIVVTFVASSAATFDPAGPLGAETYFDSLAMFVFLLLGARYLESRARDASASALEDLVRAMPETAQVVRADGTLETVPARRLARGDRVRVYPGEAFPADGRLLSGTTQVDESLLTGEARALDRGVGDAVIAGSFDLGSPVEMEVERTADDTRWAAIVALMQQAACSRRDVPRSVDRLARYFVLGVVLTALLAGAAWWAIEPARAVGVAVAVLIVTCPCALTLATPATLLAAAGSLARRGVLVRDLDAIERFARTTLAVFDKTGTLTEERLALARVECMGEHARATLLTYAATLAASSRHPIAMALADQHAGRIGMSGIRERPGLGLEGFDGQGRHWKLGRADFAVADAVPDTGTTCAWLSVDGIEAARFHFEARLRADAREAIAALVADDVEVAMLSGDDVRATRAVAERLGISAVHARASPEDKLAFVARAQASGATVAMIGDGVNDGPAIARADVSVAMGRRAPLVCARADFTLPGARVMDMVEARRTAVRALAVLRQNLAWATLYNATCIPAALLGWLPPWLAGIGMATSSLLVVANAARLAQSRAPLPATAS
jgi:P-type Cu2+ transporter